MAKAFKFRHVSQISGIFVIGSMLIIVLAVVVMARSQGWFRPMSQLTIELPEEGSAGLKPGADVMVLGTAVGEVKTIRVEDERMFADLRIRSDFMKFLRIDSTASVQRTLGLGDAYVQISRGKSNKRLADDATIPVSVNVAPAQMVEETLGQVREELIPAVHQLRLAAEKYEQLAVLLSDPQGNLQQTLAHVQNVSERLDSGHETLAGRLLNDPKLGASIASAAPRLGTLLDQTDLILRDLKKTTASLPDLASSTDEQMKRMPELISQTQESIKQLQAVLQRVDRSTEQLPALIGSIKQTTDALPGLVLQTQESFRQFQRLMEAAQRSWLVGRTSQGPQSGGGRIGEDDFRAGAGK